MIDAMQDVFSVVFKSTRPDMMSKTSLRTQLTPQDPKLVPKSKELAFYAFANKVVVKRG